MKVVVCEKYGPPEVLKIKEVAKPTPKSGEVLVKIKATAVNSADVRVRGLQVSGVLRIIMRFVLGFRGPRNPILGVVFSGVVESIGEHVKLFKPGDEVYAITGFRFGAYAEYTVIPENKVMTIKPKRASFEEAVTIPFGGTTALYFLQKAGIDSREDQKVLIYGSSGAVGTAAVQISKHFKATVTAVCGEDGVELAHSLNADYVIVYTKDDFTAVNERFDIIFDAVGKTSKKICSPLLVPGGTFVTVGGLDTASENKQQLQLLSKLFDDGEYKAIIDKTYRLEDIVEAHRYVDQGKKKGNVVIVV